MLPPPLPHLTLRQGDLRRAALTHGGLLFTRPDPLALRPGVLALAASEHGGALLVTARRDHAGGFSLLGAALAPTPQRPTLTLRASSHDHEPWAATLTRAARLLRQLDGWLLSERRKDERAREVEALLAVRRGLAHSALIGPTDVSWGDAHGCWTTLDLRTGEVTRLDAPPAALHALIRAGPAALTLAGQAWAYSLQDQRTPIAIIQDAEGVRARRVTGWQEGLLVAYQAGRTVLTARQAAH